MLDLISLPRRFAPAIAAAAIVIGGITPQVDAALIEVDLLAGGDKLITRDPATGLDWLDVDLTVNASYNDILVATTTCASLGNKNPITDLGFTHATSAQVSTFFTNAGIPNINAGFTTANFTPVESLMASIGPTGDNALPGKPTQFAVAIVSDGPSSTTVFAPLIQRCIGSQFAPGCSFPNLNGAFSTARAVLFDFVGNKSDSNPNTGHFLIRPFSVPEPTTLTIFGLGLAGLGFIRRKRTT